MEKATKIFLADLAHSYSVQDSSMLVPLNIGYIKAYVVAEHGSNVDVKLFKHPEKFLASIERESPDIVGFSKSSISKNSNNINFLISGRVRCAHELRATVVSVPGETARNSPHFVWR